MLIRFRRPIFKSGRNTTIRRGIDWAVRILMADSTEVYYFTKEGEKPGERGIIKDYGHTVDIGAKVLRFQDIRGRDIEDNHDPYCRTYDTLLAELQKYYVGFDIAEIITVIEFYRAEGGA